MTQDESYLQLALQQARLAAEAGEVPVGAIVVYEGEVVGAGQNRVLRTLDPTAHAEIVALRAAAQHLTTTASPAASSTRPSNHARCAPEPSSTPASRGSSMPPPTPRLAQQVRYSRSSTTPKLNHQMEITTGILADECGELLRNFFRERRQP